MVQCAYRLIIGLFISILVGLPSLSFAVQTIPYNKIVFFGDSLSDNGNLYTNDYGYLPLSPPYFQGRFTNGYVWSEYVAKYYYDKNYISSSNYAFGGETAIFHNPVNGYLPYSLYFSVRSYIAHTVLDDTRANTLFIIWIGSNDYLPELNTDNAEQLTTDVVDSIRAAIADLIYYGGKYFLIINVPNLSLTPYSKQHKLDTVLETLSNKHNQKLSDAIMQIQNENKDINIHLYDVNQLFSSLIKDPEVYNQKYHVNISNGTTACWQGGYWGENSDLNNNQTYALANKQSQQLNANLIAQELVAYIKSQPKAQTLKVPTGANLPTNKPLTVNDADEFAQYIVQSPALTEAYTINKGFTDGTITPCVNPDNYIFWDKIHPTAVIHLMLSTDIINYINQNYPGFENKSRS